MSSIKIQIFIEKGKTKCTKYVHQINLEIKRQMYLFLSRKRT